MNNKKGIKLLTAVVILALLAGAYYWGTRESDDDPEDVTVENINVDEDKIYLVNKDTGLFKECEIENGLAVKADDDGGYTVKGYEQYQYNQENLMAIVKSLSVLSAWDKLDNAKDISEYGLDKPTNTAKVYFTDGEEKIIKIGDKSPDGNYWYASVDGDESIYMINDIDAKRMTYGLDEVIDKKLPQVSMYEAYYIYIDQKDKPLIEIEYDEEASSKGSAGELSSYGMQTLTMTSPYKDAVVYPYNLEETILAGLPEVSIGKLIEVQPEDIEKYGLSEPVCDIKVKDKDNSLHIVVGNDCNEESVYCMVQDRPHIFTMSKSAVTPFMNSNPIDYIQKFVALKTRVDTKEVDIEKGSKKYEVTFGDAPENTDEETAKVDKRETYINGKAAEKEKFDVFFEKIIGITFDKIIDDTDENLSADGDAAVKIKYEMLNGDVTEVKYYNYGEDNNFYAVSVDGEMMYIVSRQKVDDVVRSAKELS